MLQEGPEPAPSRPRASQARQTSGDRTAGGNTAARWPPQSLHLHLHPTGCLPHISSQPTLHQQPGAWDTARQQQNTAAAGLHSKGLQRGLHIALCPCSRRPPSHHASQSQRPGGHSRHHHDKVRSRHRHTDSSSQARACAAARSLCRVSCPPGTQPDLAAPVPTCITNTQEAA